MSMRPTSLRASMRWRAGSLSSNYWPPARSPRLFEVQDAVLAGTLDGGHGVCAYWYGKHKAFSLFGTPPAWGWRANQMLGWVKYGGGQALYDELVQQVLGLNLVGFLTGPMPTQPLGWFKKEMTAAARSQGPQIPHRRPLGRSLQGDGCGGHHHGRRRDRSRHGPRPA